MPHNKMRVVVVGATGTQGGHVVRKLIENGVEVVALVRDTTAASATALTGMGAELVCADLNDHASLIRAFSGAHGVFSVVLPGHPGDPDREVRHTGNIVDAAESAGIVHLVHSSVSTTGWRERLGAKDISSDYWDGKEFAEATVRSSQVPVWSIIQPAYFMENFLPPRASAYFPRLAHGELAVATDLDVRIPLISARDIGNAVAAAFADSGLFKSAGVELSGDAASFREIAGLLSRVTGVEVTAILATPGELLADGLHRGWVDTQVWFEEVNYRATPADSEPFGLVNEKLEAWADRHRLELQQYISR